MAKTQYSLSDNPSLLGRPEGFDITVKEVRVSNGAGFIVVLTGDIMTMPGLPKVPAANKMDILKRWRNYRIILKFNTYKLLTNK